jgi:3-phenylpropionate/trans-cinnamate dioxygenase ferredoxin subunit
MPYVRKINHWGGSLYNYTQIEATDCRFYEIVSITDLEDKKRLFLEIDERPIVLFNIGGELYAIGDICSHDDGPLGDGDLDGYIITCPRHGAQFDVKTGKVLALPAIVDIPAYPVRVVDGMIEVGVPINE